MATAIMSATGIGGYGGTQTTQAPEPSEPEFTPADGWAAADVFALGNAGVTLDDIAFLPGINNGLTPNLGCRLTKNVTVKLPFIAGPTASVTEFSMATVLALMGGIGCIHRHQSIEEQADNVRKVKAFETGFLMNPACLGLKSTVADAIRLQEEQGCSGIPVTENGRMGGRLVGLVSKKDVEGRSRSELLASVMTKDLVFVKEPVTLKQATEVMNDAKVSKLPVVNNDTEIVAMISRGDLKKSLQHPDASRDANRQLTVGGACSPHEPDAWERAQALIEAGIDVMFLDTDDGVDEQCVQFIKFLKEQFPGVDIIAGRVNSLRQAEALGEAGVDGVRVGNAEGASASAIYDVAKYLRALFGIPVVADVGVRNAGQALKAFMLGATTVCLDELLDGCEEAPGDHIYREGARIKLGRNPSGGPRPVPMGVAGSYVDKGSAECLVPFILEKVRRGFQELGIMAFGDIPKALEKGVLRMERQLPPSAANLAEAPRQLPVICGSLHCRR